MYNRIENRKPKLSKEKPALNTVYVCSPKSVYPRDGSIGVKKFNDFTVKSDNKYDVIPTVHRYVKVVEIDGTRKGLILITDKAQKTKVNKFFKELELDENSLTIYKAARSTPVMLADFN